MHGIATATYEALNPEGADFSTRIELAGNGGIVISCNGRDAPCVGGLREYGQIALVVLVCGVNSAWHS